MAVPDSPYVDLNPIRAAMASGVEDSHYTAAQQRFRALMGLKTDEAEGELPVLAAFQAQGPTPVAGTDANTLPFSLEDYLALVDDTGRCCIEGKRGFIAAERPKLLDRLHIDPDTWLARMRSSRGSAHHAVGAPSMLRRFAERMRQKWVHGLSAAEALYPT